MVLALNKAGYDSLEKTCKEFLLGVKEEGKLKKVLIAREDIMRPRVEGR